jgi:hypothetical protein
MLMTPLEARPRSNRWAVILIFLALALLALEAWGIRSSITTLLR